MINIFMIPSWYPSKADPLAGLFFRDQAEFFVKYFDDARIFVSAAQLLTLSPRNIRTSYDNIMKWIYAKKYCRASFEKRFVEHQCYILKWNKLLFKGNENNIIHFHRKNLVSAINMFGTIDIIHAHTSMPAGHFARQLSREFDIPYIITEHMGPFPFRQYIAKGGGLDPLLREALDDAELVVAVSPVLSSQIEQYGIKAELCVIPNSVDTNLFFPPKVENQSDTISILTVGRFVKLKGIADLLAAVRLAIRHIPALKCRIAGYGPLEQELHDLVEQLGIQANIEWLGRLNRKDTALQMRRCSFYVLPSHHESFGVVCIEALASGKPIIATRCGGPESIVNEKVGLLVTPSDPVKLANAIIEMAHNLDNYSAKQIREYCVTRYSHEAVSPKIRSAFERVIRQMAIPLS